MAKRIDHRERVAALEAALKDALVERDAELAQRAAAQLAQYRPKRCHFDNTRKLNLPFWQSVWTFRSNPGRSWLK